MIQQLPPTAGHETRLGNGAKLALGLYILLLGVQIPGPGLTRIAPSDLFLAGFWLFAIAKVRLARRAVTVWIWLLPCLFAAGALTSAVLYGTLSSYALKQKLLGLFVLLAAYLAIVSAARDWESIRRVARLFVLGAAAQNLVALLAFFLARVVGLELPWINYMGSRLSGFLIDPNAFGGFLATALLLNLVTQLEGQPLLRGLLGWLVTVSLFVGTVLTFSRSAWLGLMVGLSVYLVLRPKVAARLLILGAMTGLAILSILGSRYLPVMQAMAARPEQITARVRIILDALRLFAAHPLTGVGLGAYVIEFGVIVHNTPVWFLTEFGLPGLVVLMGFLAAPLRQGIAAWRGTSQQYRPVVLSLSLAHLALIGLSMGIEALYQRHWWLVMALLASAYAVSRKKAERTLEP